MTAMQKRKPHVILLILKRPTPTTTEGTPAASNAIFARSPSTFVE
jgi:hypothetical protein